MPVSVTALAYTKLYLHAAQHPHAPVCGLLLTRAHSPSHCSPSGPGTNGGDSHSTPGANGLDGDPEQSGDAREERNPPGEREVDRGNTREKGEGGVRDVPIGGASDVRALVMHDAVPLFHTAASISLAPAFEIAFSLVCNHHIRQRCSFY